MFLQFPTRDSGPISVNLNKIIEVSTTPVTVWIDPETFEESYTRRDDALKQDRIDIIISLDDGSTRTVVGKLSEVTDRINTALLLPGFAKMAVSNQNASPNPGHFYKWLMDNIK